MDFLSDFLRETVAVIFETAPYLIFGFFLAGLIKTLIPARWLSRQLGRRSVGSVIKAALIGVPLPLCSCSVLPTAATLRANGASKGATTSFLISTPESGIDSISISYALLDPIMTIARPIVAFVTGVVAGIGVNVFERNGESHATHPSTDAPLVARATPSDPCASGGCGCEDEPAARPAPRRGPIGVLRQSVQYGFGPLLDDIGPYLLAGFLLTGFIGAILPNGALANPTLRGLPAMLVMLAIGVPIYVCATASTPIAAALIVKGLNPGAALVFLLAGPATNAATITVLWRLLGRRTLIIYLLAIVLVSLAAGIGLDAIYAARGVDPAVSIGAAGRAIPRWIEIPLAAIILALLVRSMVRTRKLQVWSQRLRRIGRPLGIDPGAAINRKSRPPR